MLETIINYLKEVNHILWHPYVIAFFELAAIFFTVRSKFFQITHFGFIFKNTLSKIFKKDEASSGNKVTMSPFQAMATSLAGTVGMGNIAGVALALSVGGPGAIFWMWVVAFFGMVLKTAEITIGVHYREVDEKGNVHGGPMYYINKGLGWKPLAILFSVGMIVNAFFASSMIQSHTVGRAFNDSFNANPYIITTLMSIIVGIVIIGGVKSIGKFSERLVPLMAVIYIFFGLVIIVINYQGVPTVFSDIFTHAFAPLPAAGGIAGIAVIESIRTGMMRGMQSNEAGLGTSTMAHSTANTKHPFEQGMWGAFEVFIDTIIICTITALVILLTDTLIMGAGKEQGIVMVTQAFSTSLGTIAGKVIISFAILTFCLSTQIGFFIYFETSVNYLMGGKAIKYLKWIYLLPGIAVAGFADVSDLWQFVNFAIGSVAVPNLIAIIALSSVFVKLKKDYLTKENKYTTEITDVSKEYIKMSKK